MKAVRTNQIVSMTASAIFGFHYAYPEMIHSDIVSVEFDRWGMKVVIRMGNLDQIVGRISNKKNFNGTIITHDGKVKCFKSYHKGYNRGKDA